MDYNNHSLNILTVRFIVVLNEWLKLRSTSNVLFCWAIIVNAVLSLYYSVSLSLSLLPAMRRLSIFFLIVSYSFFSSIFYSLFYSFLFILQPTTKSTMLAVKSSRLRNNFKAKMNVWKGFMVSWPKSKMEASLYCFHCLSATHLYCVQCHFFIFLPSPISYRANIISGVILSLRIFLLFLK